MATEVWHFHDRVANSMVLCLCTTPAHVMACCVLGTAPIPQVSQGLMFSTKLPREGPNPVSVRQVTVLPDCGTCSTEV